MRCLRCVGWGPRCVWRHGGGRCREFRPNLLGLLLLGPSVAAVQGRGCGRVSGSACEAFLVGSHAAC